MLDLDTLLKETFLAQAEHHATLVSTNDQARLVPIGEGETPRLIVADVQTAGRGRDQAIWWTGKRSLAFSLVLDGRSLQTDPRRRLMIALVAGIAVAESVASLFDTLDAHETHEIGLHWPNDVFVDGRKLCGVLVEVPQDGRIIVGIGINTNDRVSDAPPELADRLTTLYDLTGVEWNHTDLLLKILRRFEAWQDTLMTDSALVGCRANELCLQHGRPLTLDPGDGRLVTGRCLGITDDGALRLDTTDGVRMFYSGRLI